MVLILNIHDDDMKVRSDQPDGCVEVPQKFDFTQYMRNHTNEESGNAKMFSYEACLTGIIQKGVNDDDNYCIHTGHTTYLSQHISIRFFHVS